MVKKKGKRETENKQHFLKRKRRQAMSASNGTKAVDTRNRVHDTTHLAVTAGQQTLTNYAHKERMSGLVKHRDYPPHSYIVNERYNSRNKMASQEDNNNSEWQEPGTSPTPNPKP